MRNGTIVKSGEKYGIVRGLGEFAASARVEWTEGGEEDVPLDRLEPTLPRQVAAALIEGRGWIVGLVDEFEPGYSPTTYGPYDEQDEAKAVAKNINDAKGISEREALMVVFSSMRAGNVLR